MTTDAVIPVAVTGQVADVDVTIWADGIQSAIFSFGPADDFAAHTVGLASVGGTISLNGVTFDDEAASELSGSPPYSGHFRPIAPLSALDGMQTSRSWQLRVDTTGSDTTLNGYWSVTITYAGCVPDRDSDGVPDSRDACPTVAAHTASGCPLTTRTLTAKYKLGKFRGLLSSPVAGCKAIRPVTIWKVRTGPDRKIGTATTGSTGGYKLKHAKRPGRYYATSLHAVVNGMAECPAVRSARFRIH